MRTIITAMVFLMTCVVHAADTDAQTSVKNTSASRTRMVFKSRKLEIKGVKGGKDWVGRGSLTTSGDNWVFAYTDGYQHGRKVPRVVRLRFSADEGKTWTEPDTLLGGTPVKGAPSQTKEPDRVELAEGIIITCPNDDLIYVGRTHNSRSNPNKYPDGTVQFRSTDGGASWKNEGPLTNPPLAVMALGYAVAGDTIFISLMGGASDHINTSLALYLYKSTDNGKSWQRVSQIGDMSDEVNETGVVYAGNNTLMVVCRTFREKTTKMRISKDMGVTWGPFIDITDQVSVVQQPKLRRYADEPGRI